LQPKDVPPYKAISNRHYDELIVHIENKTNTSKTTIYQQSVINRYLKYSRVSTYVVPLPNYSYNYSIIDKIKSFKDKKDYVFELHPKNWTQFSEVQFSFDTGLFFLIITMLQYIYHSCF